ncbi:MAG TPA: SIS domain-containing protein [Candidatus Limnocylindrales bacterium]
MPTTDFDRNAPLPGPPDPWESTSAPSPRSGPPYHMTDMIAAEPALAERLLGRLAVPDGDVARLVATIREVARAGDPIVVTGCGTSEHGALGVAEILAEAMADAGMAGPRPVAGQAFELALDPPSRGLVIGISHEGGTAATNRALEAARAAGARTAIVTVSERSPGAALADVVVTTGELDQSWCHTVGYVSPLLAATAIGAALRGEAAADAGIRRLMADGARDAASAGAMAATLANARHLIVIASGADRTAGRELTLKIEEAAWIPTAYRDLETFLHGHLPATDETTGLVLILADRRSREDRSVRARQALAAANALGVRCAAIVSADASGGLEPGSTRAGRLVVPVAPSLPATVAALLGTATALQLLTERIARARGTNPDPIRRDDPRYLAAAAQSDG